MRGLFTQRAAGRGRRLPGALWKDCERTKGRPGEVMSAPRTSPLGPRSPTFGLATLKSGTHTHTCMSEELAMHAHTHTQAQRSCRVNAHAVRMTRFYATRTLLMLFGKFQAFIRADLKTNMHGGGTITGPSFPQFISK